MGDALAVGDALLLPSKIILDKTSQDHRPISATKEFWDECNSKKPSDNAINQAVESM